MGHGAGGKSGRGLHAFGHFSDGRSGFFELYAHLKKRIRLRKTFVLVSELPPAQQGDVPGSVFFKGLAIR